MTALAGVPGVDRPWTVEDVSGQLLVVKRDGLPVEVAQAPDRVVLRAAWVRGHVLAGMARVHRAPGRRPVLVVGVPWPASGSGRVVYVLDGDPAVVSGNTKLEGIRVA